MNAKERKKALEDLINKYTQFKSNGRLELSSEETIRMWLNDFLEIFGWDVRDTTQILQEKILTKEEKEKIKEIESSSNRPDYTFKLNNDKLTFLDAKNIESKIEDDKDSAFQIKSYGWSIMAPCAFLSNFEELAIYDCTYMPEKDQDPRFGRLYLKLDEYLDNFNVLESYLLKENVYSGKLKELYADTLVKEKNIDKVSPDLRFAEQLSEFRLLLATNILENNKGKIDQNSDLLSYLVQVIINRIIFIRVCEARKIEKEGLLLSFKKDGFWKTFVSSSYGDFYTHYDGSLFDRVKELDDINIDDEIFDELISYFYYPSPYKFDVIPTKLLSDIYEIFLSKKLEIDGDKVVDRLKLEYLKTNGAVSTPQFLVKDLIRRTLNKTELLNKEFEELLDIKILDFACGSGIFLIEIYDYLEKVFIELFKKNKSNADISDLFIETDQGIILTLEGKRIIIQNCIFGIDIDLEAVEVARMSLSLKVIDSSDFYTQYTELGVYAEKILHNVGDNVKCGNALVATDVLSDFPDIKNNEEQLYKTQPFDWRSESGFFDIFETKNGFDYIFSNPPYVEVKNYNVQFPFMHKYIKQKYKSATNGKVDLAIPFIERGESLLNESGRLGFIVQKRFFKTDYGKNIREFISDSNILSEVVDFKSSDLFKNRITYIAFLILDKQKPEMVKYSEVDEDPIKLAFKYLSADIDHSKDTASYPSKTFDSGPWNFEDGEMLKIKSDLQNLGSFKEVAKIKVGIQVLWDQAYHIRVKEIKDNYIIGDTHLQKNLKVELDACRPLVCNESFYPFKPESASVFVIFPYEFNGSDPILFSDYLKRYPMAGKYLLKFKDVIKKNIETNSEEEKWHLYTRVQNHGALYPKIVTPMTSNDTYASVIKDSKYYCDNANIYFIELPEKEDKYLYSIAGVINSTIFSILARSITNPQQNGYYKFNKQFLDPVPFPKENFLNNKNELIEKISKISIKIADCEKKYLNSNPAQKTILKNMLIALWGDLDNLVYDLYGLSDSQKEYFIKRGRSINRVDLLDKV